MLHWVGKPEMAEHIGMKLESLLKSLKTAVQKSDSIALRHAASAAMVAAGYLAARPLQKALGQLLHINIGDKQLPLLIEQIEMELQLLIYPSGQQAAPASPSPPSQTRGP